MSRGWPGTLGALVVTSVSSASTDVELLQQHRASEQRKLEAESEPTRHRLSRKSLPESFESHRHAEKSLRQMIESVRTKLLRWDILPEQIDDLVRTRKVQKRMNIYSPVAGTVIEKAVVEKCSVKTGDVLYRLVNLDSVWVNLDVYEHELGWIQYGRMVDITAEAFPGREFHGRVVLISPVVDRESRTIKVRVNVSNVDRLLKPGMFVSARGLVPLRGDGSPAPTGVGGKYICPMHPEVIQDTPGSCPRCSMPLE